MVGWSNQINFDYLPSTLTITHETFRTFTTYFTIKPLNIIIHIHDLRKTREILTLMMSGCRSCCFKCPNSVMAVRHHRPCRGREVNHVIDWDKAKVVVREAQRQTRWIKEALWITKTPTCMNRDAGSYQLSYDQRRVALRSAPVTCATAVVDEMNECHQFCGDW